MKEGRLNAHITNGKTEHRINLKILKWVEDGIHFMYAPALDLTGYGASEGESNESFKVMLEEFIKYTDNKKTLFAELQRLGWKVNKKKVTPPAYDELLRQNDTFRELSNMPGVVSSQTSVGLGLALA